MKHKVLTKWNGEMSFDAMVSGHLLTMDANAEAGGKDGGPRPKELMLASVSGCTGMDVVSILKKMKVEIEGLNISVEADLTEEHPRHYTKMHIRYEFSGKDLPMDKLEKAVSLSQEKYCGVSYMYRKAFEVTHEIVIA
jgi:putative redox protein